MLAKCRCGLRTCGALLLLFGIIGTIVGMVNVFATETGDSAVLGVKAQALSKEADHIAFAKDMHIPHRACLALIGTQNHLEEITMRVQHLNKMQNFKFDHRYLVFDTRGVQVSPQMQSIADELVRENSVDTWTTVDYSPSYKLSVNRTAEWNDSIATRQSSGHGVSFDDAQTDDVQLAFYFAIDKCAAHGSPYVAIFQLDQILYSAPNVSWVEDAIDVLERNQDLVLVSPAFPGFESRKLRQRPTTRPIAKANSGQLYGSVEAEDTTCQHPYTLPGRAILLSTKRYRKLPPRNSVKEHRCGGQLVRGKPCRSIPYVRSCGGMRTWEAALECVICNGERLQQGSLKDWHRAWSQHAPLTSVRHDLSKLRADIASIERGQYPAMMGPEYHGVSDFLILAG
ncbi:unnamed protein product [Durusdinium trenchii]|uniref:Aspartate aminotransferase n=2 Tax=Durusdinium trenchii TaxID=1381693 RepID=A0ABP0REP4_9DINO